MEAGNGGWQTVRRGGRWGSNAPNWRSRAERTEGGQTEDRPGGGWIHGGGRHFTHGTGGNQHPGGRRIVGQPNALQATMNQMAEAMKGILLRLTLLEGGQGPDPAGRGTGSAAPSQPVTHQRQSGPVGSSGSNPHPGPNRGPGPRTETHSYNLDFASVCKYIYRLVQLEHHAGNWIQLPAALRKRLDKFAEDIKPP